MSLEQCVNCFSPEFRLLLACLSCTADEEKETVFSQRIVQPMNWELFVQLAVRHGVYQPVYKALSSLSAAVPPQRVMTDLQQRCRDNAVKAVLQANELVRLVNMLEENGVEVVALKGQALAQRLYGSITERPAGDIDLLVSPAEVVSGAAELVREDGYREMYPGEAMPAWYRRLHFQNGHHISFWHGKRETNLELHWRLGRAGMDVPVTGAKNGRKVTLAGYDIPVLNYETELLFLALHGAAHGWGRLRWLYDIVKLIQADNAIDWAHTSALADRSGLRPVVHQALLLAHGLLKAPLPAQFAATLEKDGRGRKLACLAVPLLADADIRPLPLKCRQDLTCWYRMKYYQFQLRTGGEKMRFLRQHFDPPEADVRLVSLPARLRCLYYAIRPLLWLWRRVRRTAVRRI